MSLDWPDQTADPYTTRYGLLKRDNGHDILSVNTLICEIKYVFLILWIMSVLSCSAGIMDESEGGT